MSRNRLLRRLRSTHPLAITMWDFSWLERRWPGAGYEDWGEALDGLKLRGYDAVRIDAYPHLIASDPRREWSLQMLWNQVDWGSPAPIDIRPMPALADFIDACAAREIRVALSSWFRRDTTDRHMEIKTAEDHADIWLRTLEQLGDRVDGLLYVDLCNEWPGSHWAPYFRNDPPEMTWDAWHTEASMDWMRRSIERVRSTYPDLPLCYSMIHIGRGPETHDLSFMDLLEPHVWMVGAPEDSSFNKTVGYSFALTDPAGFHNMQRKAEALYREREGYWRDLLVDYIRNVAGEGRAHKQPLGTTECWGVVDYKDYPLLNWDWVKDLCELGTATAAATGQWALIATSNFCGPQFRGMWRDTAWHQRLTRAIHSAKLPEL